jgi:ubiquinone/menaquinone biosynthesis C-methylase UbiE
VNTRAITDRNRQIYETGYSAAQLDANSRYAYDRKMVALRRRLVADHAEGGDVLDLGCGTGVYLAAAADGAGRTVGVDFSRSMLSVAAARAGDRAELVQADVGALPFRDESFDLVYSFATLYYVADLQSALDDVARVLRPGGVAVLELGNRRSLNSLVSDVQFRHAGWAEPHYVAFRRLGRMVAATGLRTVEWRCFQALPMVGAPRRLFFLAPFLLMSWKAVLGLGSRRMLDERLSSSPVLRRWAFRHLVVLTKP